MSTQTGRQVRVEIAATYGAAKTVSALSKANPGVASSATHGLTDGVIGYMNSVVGMDEVNGVAFSVSNPLAGTFELEDEDTSAYGTFVSGDFVPVATWATLSVATSYKISDANPDQLDTTTLLDRIKQQEAGLLGAQTVQIDGFSDPQNAAVKLVRAAAKAGGYVVVRITLANGERRIFRGQPGLPGEDLSVNQKATAGVSFTVKGAVGMLPV